MPNRCGDALCRQFHGELSDLRRAVHMSAQMQFIMRGCMFAKPLADTMQTDGGNVVLRAGIMATADFDAHIPEIFRHLPRWKYFSQRPGHPLGGGNSQTAGVGARARDDVFDEFSTLIFSSGPVSLWFPFE